MENYGDIDSKFRFVILASKRAKQLLRGDKPRVKSKYKNPIRIAQDEVSLGFVDYDIIQPQEEKEVEPEEEQFIGEAIEEKTEAEIQLLSVPNGDILNIDNAVNVLISRPTCVLNIIGPTNSGKTTLGVSLYEAFLSGPFGKWNFGGSKTLIAFEKRDQLSRAKSGRSMPDTAHTPFGEGLGFLHLVVQNDDRGLFNLLISDRSGEFYTRISDNLEQCEELYEVKRADYVLFLIDGDKLASDERHGVRSDFLMLLETLIENEIIKLADKERPPTHYPDLTELREEMFQKSKGLNFMDVENTQNFMTLLVKTEENIQGSYSGGGSLTEFLGRFKEYVEYNLREQERRRPTARD